MKKPKLVILRGRPTSGKSTAYDNLKKSKSMKDWLFVDHCALKTWLGKDLGKQALFAVLKVVMPTKKDIIIEEMSEKTLRKYINQYIKKYEYKVIVFQFTVGTKTAYKRDVERAKAGKHLLMGKKKIKELHRMHDERFDKNSFLIDTNKLGKRKVVEFILKNIK